MGLAIAASMPPVAEAPVGRLRAGVVRQAFEVREAPGPATTASAHQARFVSEADVARRRLAGLRAHGFHRGRALPHGDLGLLARLDGRVVLLDAHACDVAADRAVALRRREDAFARLLVDRGFGPALRAPLREVVAPALGRAVRRFAPPARDALVREGLEAKRAVGRQGDKVHFVSRRRRVASLKVLSLRESFISACCTPLLFSTCWREYMASA